MTRITTEQVRDLVATLRFLTRSQRMLVLRTLNQKQMKIVTMACLNLAMKAHVLSPENMQILVTHRNKLHKLADKSISFQEKRDILTQRGGFVSAILPILHNFLNSFP